MEYIIPFVYIILANGTTSYLAKKTFGESLPLTLMGTAFTLFFSQFIFNTFYVGFYFNIIYAIIFVFLFVLNLLKKKNISFIKEKYFSKGLIAFIVLYIFIVILDFNRTFSVWDEFSHWGVMVKEMLRLDNFYSVDVSTLMVHKDYPPIVQLFELFFVKICGSYSEGTIIRSFRLLTFSFIIPPLTKNEPKQSCIKSILKYLMVFIIFYFILIMFDSHGIVNTIYNDYLLGVILAYCLYIVFSSNNVISYFKIILLTVAMSFMILTKQIGLPLVLLVLFFLILKSLYNYKKKKQINYKKIIISSLLCLIPFILWIIWNNYVKFVGADSQFNLESINLLNLPGIITGNSGELWQHETFLNYFNAIFTRGIITYPLKLTYWQIMFILLVIIGFMKRKDKSLINGYKYNLVSIISILGAIGYAFMLMCLYIFSFGSYEGPILASFERYIPTYLLAIVFITFIIFLLLINKLNVKKSLFYFSMILALISCFQDPTVLYEKSTPAIIKKSENIYQYHAQKIISQTEELSKVFIIAQNTNGEYQYSIKYYSNPRTTNYSHWNLPTGEEKESINIDDLYYEIGQYDYLYLAIIDQSFIDEYSKMFLNNDIKSEQLYKIKYKDGNLRLISLKN